MTTLADALTNATAAVNANAQQYFDLENRVALREAAAVMAAGLVPAPDDLTELARADSLGTRFVAQPGGTANALVVSLATGVSWPALLADMDFLLPTMGANSGPVTVAVSGFVTPPAAAAGSGLPAGTMQLLTKGGSALKAGDIAGDKVKVRADGAGNLRLQGVTASELAASANALINLLKIPGWTPFMRSAAGTYTLFVPAGRTVRIAILRGGGGGGGGATSSSTAGSGGGQGGLVFAMVVTTKLDTTFLITVGAGGNGGGSVGTNGGTSSVVVQSGLCTDAAGNDYGVNGVLAAAAGGGGGIAGTSSGIGTPGGSGGVAAGPAGLTRSGFGGGQGISTNPGFVGGVGGGDNNQAPQGGAGIAAGGPGTAGSGASTNGNGGRGQDGEVQMFY